MTIALNIVNIRHIEIVWSIGFGISDKSTSQKNTHFRVQCYRFDVLKHTESNFCQTDIGEGKILWLMMSLY